MVVLRGVVTRLLTDLVPFAGGRTRWEWYKYLADPEDSRTETEKWVAACEAKRLQGEQAWEPVRRTRTGAPVVTNRSPVRAARPVSAPPAVVVDPAADEPANNDTLPGPADVPPATPAVATDGGAGDPLADEQELIVVD